MSVFAKLTVYTVEAVGFVVVCGTVSRALDPALTLYQRIVAAKESPDWSIAVYSIHTILVLVAPSVFAASIYMVLGRIILLIDGEKYSLIRRRWLTKFFVIGDVMSFLLQGAGMPPSQYRMTPLLILRRRRYLGEWYSVSYQDRGEYDH